MTVVKWTGPVMALSIAASASAAWAEPDDWELAVDPARSLSVAAVRYEDGKAVVVQCAPAGLRVVLIGLPASEERVRVLTATRPDGRSDTQTWLADTGSAAVTAAVNGRDARFLRGGGLLQLRSPEGSATPIRAAFDLPTEHRNLDQVITACGYAVSDERDSLPRAGEDLKSQWEVDHAEDIARSHRPITQRSSRSVSGDARPRTPPPPRPARPADLSCIVSGGALTQCRFDHGSSGTSDDDQRRLRFLTELDLENSGAAANEGRVYYPWADSQPLIQVRLERMN